MSSVAAQPLMKVMETPLAGVLVLEPKVFADARGFFLEGYNEKLMADCGIRERFVQDNQSYSLRNVVRGLHYQISHPQGKLVRVVAGEILDVAVDLRRSSATFGKWYGVTLSGERPLDAVDSDGIRARISCALGWGAGVVQGHGFLRPAGGTHAGVV